MLSRIPKYIWLVAVVFIFPILANAHGNNYFEFNPDPFRTKSFNVSSGGAIYEVFLPSNEFFGGFDIWLDNSGSSGLAYVELWRSDNMITSKSLTIPHIDQIAGGQKVHVDWGSLIPVVSNSKYKIKISSTMPDLRIYYASRVKFLGHNEPHISDYLNGAAEIDGEEKEFSFKFALYETSETSVPVISNVGWAIISEGEMRVNFNANEPVDYKIEYGPSGQGYSQSSNFSGNYSFCNQSVSVCNIMVSVAPDTTYQYTLTVKDFWGNQGQAIGTFTSGQTQSPSPTPTPAEVSLVISNFRVVSKTDESLEVAWTTNKIANSNLLISFSSDLITITAVSDPTFELEHVLETDSVLSPGTTYTARITSADLDNNESSSSLSFKTLSASTSTPTPTPALTPSTSSGPSPTPLPGASPAGTTNPQISSQTIPSPLAADIITSSSSSGGDTNIGTVQWNAPVTGEPSNGYRVDVFDKDGKLVTTILVPDKSHGIEVPDLADGEYTVIVYANNEGVFKKIDKPVELKAGEASFIDRLISFWPYLLIVVALIGVFIWSRLRSHPKSPYSAATS
ncbi:MAG: hypothetical protein Q7S43_05425 [bacterium]|nr:hypothetical protein [bacterium]